MHSTLHQYSYIKPDQLCIGLYVHLDLNWVKHPFPFPSFKIENQAQIQTIQNLGLRQVRYTLNKSDCQPSEVIAYAKSPIQVGTHFRKLQKVTNKISHKAAREEGVICLEKRQMIERIDQLDEKIRVCESKYLLCLQKLKLVWRNVTENPFIVTKQTNELINNIVSTVMIEPEIAIHLMVGRKGIADTSSHALNVAILSMMMGQKMGLPSEQIRWIGIGALFHDVGNTDLLPNTKDKSEPSNSVKEEGMLQHCKRGVHICNKLQLPYESILIVWQHQERIDGSGYPEKLISNKISLLAKIVAVADAFEEICNPLNLQQTFTPHEALSIVYAQSCFDRKALAACVQCLGVYPPGTIVLLSNGIIAMVVAINRESSLKPVVLAYDPAVTKNDVILIDLEHEVGISIIRAVHPHQLSLGVMRFLSARKKYTHLTSIFSGRDQSN